MEPRAGPELVRARLQQRLCFLADAKAASIRGFVFEGLVVQLEMLRLSGFGDEPGHVSWPQVHSAREALVLGARARAPAARRTAPASVGDRRRRSWTSDRGGTGTRRG